MNPTHLSLTMTVTQPHWCKSQRSVALYDYLYLTITVCSCMNFELFHFVFIANKMEPFGSFVKKNLSACLYHLQSPAVAFSPTGVCTNESNQN